VISSDNIANGVRVHRGIPGMTVALRIESVRETSPDNRANGIRVPKGDYGYTQYGVD
jgi:hypothetical protein